MDFLSKIFKQAKSGSGPSVENKAPNLLVKSEHNTYVEIAREFVEEIVEKLPDNSGKSNQPAKYLDLEDSTSRTSVALSEKSCDTLPDLLQPESVYKKQTDTDTDTSHTTEYESAVETDVQDSASLNDGLVSDEIFGSAENIVDQQLHCQQGDQVVNSPEACIIENDNVCNDTVILDTSREVLSCNHVEEKSEGGSILMPLDVFAKSDSLSDCVTLGESSYITSSSSPGDITVLCAGLANLELNSSLESPSVPADLSTCSVGETVAENSFVGQELDTIHLVETDEHELSILVLDNTVDTSAIPELKHVLSIVSDPSIQNTENIVDDQTLDKCNSFQVDNGNASLEFLPCNTEVDFVDSDPPAEAHEEKVECVEKSFETTSCGKKLECFEKSNAEASSLKEEEVHGEKPIFETTVCKKDTVYIEQPVFEATSCNEEHIDVEVPFLKKELIDVEVNKECCVQQLNATFEAQDKQIQYVNLNSTRDKEAGNLSQDSTSELLTGISSSAVHDLKFSVQEFKDSLVEEISLSCTSDKEPVDKICTTVVEDRKIFVEKLNPIPQEEEKLISEGISVGCEFKKESIVDELSQPTVERVSFVVEPIKETQVESSDTSGTKNISVLAFVQPQVNNVVADCETFQKQQESKGEANECTSYADTSNQIPLDVIKESHTAVYNLESKEVTGEPLLCSADDQLTKPEQESVVAANLSEQKNSVEIPEVVTASVKVDHILPVQESVVAADLSEQKNSVEIPEVVTASVKVDHILPVQESVVAADLSEQKNSVEIPEAVTASVKVDHILPRTSEHIDQVDVQTHEEEIVNVVQVTPLGTSLDFDNLAAEAANISNDFLTASQEVTESDFLGVSESTVFRKNSVTMTDTGATQRPDENVSSLPLDVKWLADSQNNSQKNRSSNVSSLKMADASPRLKVNSSPRADTRSSVIDCTVEDPFKRRSLLSNSPPREVLRTDDNKCALPVQSTVRMEKGSGESSDVKENHSEAGPNTAETFSIPGEEIFKDSSAFEFLSSMASTQPLRDYRKESLYVKFDPLVGSAPIARTNENIPLPSISQETIVSGDTPEQSLVSGSPRHATPVKNAALDLLDRLISLTPSPKKPESPKPPPVVVTQEPEHVEHTRKEWEEMTEELHVLRELLDREDHRHQDEISKYKAEVEALQNKLNIIQQRNQEAEEREQKLNKKIIDKAQGQKQMSMIMEEYEKTISRLVAEKEAEHQAHELEKESLTKDKDLALGHLTNIEIAFSDVHLKYERSKNVIEGFKKNEEVLRASLAEFETTIRKQEQKYEMLKSHAMQQLEGANQELEAFKKSQQAENAKLRAMLKKSELKTSSLEEMLDQKIKENQELASICDDLISKVGN